MSRHRHVLATALCAVFVLASIPADGTRVEAPLVPLAGEMTVSAPAGVHGIRFAVPEGARIDIDRVQVHDFDGDFAQVMSHSPDAPESSCLERFCTHYGFNVVPDWYARNEHGLLTEEQYNNGFLGPADCETDASTGDVQPCLVVGSILEMYIATDAPLSFTMFVEDVPGTANYRADGEVDGELVELPTDTCPGGDCERWEIGHAVRHAGTDDRPGAVAGFGYARASYDDIAPGIGANATASLSANVCSYPSFFVQDGSTDPADHPLGCDYHPHPGDNGLQYDPRWFDASTTQGATFQAVGYFFGSGNANGEAYAGFNLRNHQPLPGYDGTQNAWAAWITQGIFVS